MSTDSTDRRLAPGRLAVLLVANLWRAAVDGFVLGVWTVFLVAVFLHTAYPRWAFYTLLVLGAVVHTQMTDGWRLPRDGRGGR